MAKKKYKSYKSSKTLWQEEIPSHWQETDLRMVFTENKVRNVGLIENNLLSLSYGKLKRKDIDNATGLVPASFEGYQIIDKDYIVLRFTDLQNDKKSLRVGYCPERGIITNAYVAIAPKEKTFSKYYYYQLHFLDTIKYFYNLGGGVRQSLSYKEFGRETVIVPESEEQTAIANFLDYKLSKIDRFIHKKKQLIKLLNEQKMAIINQAVMRGLNPNAKMKPSGIEWLGDIPEHWEVKKLKYVANCFPSNIDKHTKEDEKKVRLCNYTDVYKNDFITNDMELMVATATDDQIEKFTLLKGDVIITKDSETADDIANPALVVEELENVVCGYHLSVLRPYSKLNGSFLLRALQCKVINVQFELCSNGVTRVGLGVHDMKSAKIPIPPIDEQQIIVSYIEKEVEIIHKTITTIEKEITLTQEYKTVLIAESVTGKIDVRDFVAPEILEEENYEEIEEELNFVAEDEKEYQNKEMEE